MHTSEKISLIGGGGHGIVVIDALRSSGFGTNIELWDNNPRLNGEYRLDLKVQSPIVTASIAKHVHVAIGDNRARSKVSQELQDYQTRFFVNVLHPRSIVAESSELATGVFLAADAIIAPLVRIGNGVIVNHGAIVDHECQIDDWVHIAPNATLGGGVCVGLGTLVGAGSVVLPGRRIGKWVRVGAGAVVTRDIPDGVTAIGCPARWSNNYE